METRLSVVLKDVARAVKASATQLEALRAFRPINHLRAQFGWVESAYRYIRTGRHDHAIDSLRFLAQRVETQASGAQMPRRVGKTARKSPDADAARFARQEARARHCQSMRGFNPGVEKAGGKKKKAKK